MKSFLILCLVAVTSFYHGQDEMNLIKIHSDVNDTSQYQLIISEPGYDSWCATNCKPEWYHSENYYKNFNHQYVREWNFRVRSIEYSEPYDNIIHYNYFTDYGINLEYKLYCYFKFMEEKYNMTLLVTDQR